MTKEQFIKLMEAIKERYYTIERIYDKLDDVFGSVGDSFINETSITPIIDVVSEIVEDNELSKKCKATINELTYQLEHGFNDIKSFSIRKNSKGEIKEVLIKFKY